MIAINIIQNQRANSSTVVTFSPIKLLRKIVQISISPPPQRGATLILSNSFTDSSIFKRIDRKVTSKKLVVHVKARLRAEEEVEDIAVVLLAAVLFAL